MCLMLIYVPGHLVGLDNMPKSEIFILGDHRVAEFQKGAPKYYYKL